MQPLAYLGQRNAAHLGSDGQTPQRRYAARIESEIADLKGQLAENRQAQTCFKKGRIPSAGSARWMAKPGYQQLYCDCLDRGLVDFGVVLGR